MTAKDKTRILLIEDDPEMYALIVEDLVEREYEVLGAHNGRDGFETILRRSPDLVLSDINMPGMSGYEVLERLIDLAPRFSQMPFIFLTAQSARDDELRGRTMGADDYVTKPIDFDILATIIDARLRGVARNGRWPEQANLNEREIECLTWSARGKTSQEIGEILGLSKRTVDFHMENSRRKLGVGSRIQAVVKAATGQIISPWDED